MLNCLNVMAVARLSHQQNKALATTATARRPLHLRVRLIKSTLIFIIVFMIYKSRNFFGVSIADIILGTVGGIRQPLKRKERTN